MDLNSLIPQMDNNLGRLIKCNILDFSPKKLLCMSRRGTYTSDTHQVTTAALRSEQMCNYDLDELDQRWLNAANGERAQMGMLKRD